ncbi:CDP-diacylglycerol--glycerol-3-phosphate 3-phosphatidyltransferase [marine gamma proteobacterium HTCC2143]|jgi:CDP-diacylglycerol--glycerol-3-phosphate 3-phosphatidyltransferase|uniref:CDP-diacylglycerol--glycerol-3-phosphate 3-phosphatidyltransferase n=1 Tax=marine gamma proteobacterium HTCC2143 TaxID=247633 RepID=A0YH98_9GAMM|nr:CDP-diacylglycerol--glycerol-3-phosphate 3-phosphatidyltransferase [marine gamma proteobacterium HTCC2143]|tara:strand:- start:1820 stop:2383 length:564 start_codon:yes stop_codon:yes gene_type:complete
MNIPNTLTLLRILLIPVIIAVFYLPYDWSYLASAGIFMLASITDWLDGYLARKLNQSTPFGAFLDPVADKLMVSIALVLLVERFGAWWFTVPAMIIIGREIVISALREWMAELGRRTSVAVSYIGKVKTGFQMVAILVLLAAAPERSGILLNIGIVLLYLSAILTLWSMLVYIRAAWPTFDLGSGTK